MSRAMSVLTTALELLAYAAIVAGVFLIAGAGVALVVAGVLLVAASWALSGMPIPRRRE